MPSNRYHSNEHAIEEKAWKDAGFDVTFLENNHDSAKDLIYAAIQKDLRIQYSSHQTLVLIVVGINTSPSYQTKFSKVSSIFIFYHLLLLAKKIVIQLAPYVLQ